MEDSTSQPPAIPQTPTPPTAPPVRMGGAPFHAPPLHTPPTPPPGAERTLSGVADPTTPHIPRPPTYVVPAQSAPASTVGVAPESDSGSGQWGWRALVAFAAGGLVAAAGFGAASIAATEDQVAIVPTETTVVAGVPAPIEIDPGTNVAAFVAQQLGPSVVQIETDLGVGSGVVYENSLVLTNHHVIADASVITVRSSDGRSFAGTLIGSDPAVDIAVVRLSANDLPVAERAEPDSVEVGEVAVAIGSPFELQQTVTQGIVSAVNRPMVSGESITAMIQTDAPINPGNSGGALADAQGRVIGINTAIRTDGVSSSNAGIGFAVPIETALRTAERIVSGESLAPAFLGVAGDRSENGDAGVVVTEVTAGSGAADAGLQVGDRILSFDGAPVTELFELAGLVRANRPGDEVTFEIIRDGQPLTLRAILGEAPEGG